ncbi:nucleoside phosphorylase domain-containing protein [Aspergillus karnatakaensis]|uniref:nucleoside phosphorylase domain-containing protein n=1 Tax=Aspergillus karnatakaensis TaxID=1810916 RepID=UPI003CCDF653
MNDGENYENLDFPPAKRRKHDLPESSSRITKEDYTVGWICALPIEMAASRAMLDEIHPSIAQPEFDTNTYTLGQIGEHIVVVVCLPSAGTNPAATAAANMLRSFPKIRFGLMVGVGGGAPGPPGEDAWEDLHLGDVVVSSLEGEHGGVIQHDFGKTVGTGKFVQTRSLNKPPAVLRSGVATLRALHLSEGPSTALYVSQMLERKPRMVDKFRYPGGSNDLLFHAHYDYCEESQGNCESWDKRRLVLRKARDTSEPAVHYGVIGSANQVMRHGATREKLRQEKNISCFEMEAAGLMDQFPRLVVRGICDYSDTHKSKQWQPYAAATAAAYAKELLAIIPAVQVTATREITDILNIGQQRMEEQEILNWLAPPTYGAQYSDNIGRHQHGTCEWFLQSPEFASWVEGH